MQKFLLFFYISLIPALSYAKCEVFNSQGKVLHELHDALFLSLKSLSNCPQDVLSFKEALIKSGLNISPSMVANRGRHNPAFGSFSFFETVKGQSNLFPYNVNDGDFFFGHFTTLSDGLVSLDQAPRRGALMIELISWDYQKEVFNFYELIGTGNGGRWFYRGDSLDAYLDNEDLKRQIDPSQPQFGNRMRCSACHISGGPIMKEIEAPHNDWWTASRPLGFGDNGTSNTVEKWLSELGSAPQLAQSVKTGIDKLENSPSFTDFKQGLSLQEQLRPLFCTMEINLISGKIPNENPKTTWNVSSSYWVNPFLSQIDIEIKSETYFKALLNLGMQFPETNVVDADHPWLAPAKGYSDQKAIQTLMKNGLVDEEFVSDVLAVDFKRPLFSRKRCELLQLLPKHFSTQWPEIFVENLQTSHLEGAKKLLVHLTGPEFSSIHHARTARKYLSEVQRQLSDEQSLQLSLVDLQEKRASVFEDEISQNPRGQILEPGFRVIFPWF